MVPEANHAPYSSRMASAVTLNSGQILVTGGSGMEKDVFLFNGTEQTVWTHRKPMKEGRLGHASTVTMLAAEETVLVAGGWSRERHPLKSVELYKVGQDTWERLQSLPNPRVYFTLQVLDSRIFAIGGYFTKDGNDEREYPASASIAWSEDSEWGDWTEEENSFDHRNGFMTTKVPISWVERLCERSH